MNRVLTVRGVDIDVRAVLLFLVLDQLSVLLLTVVLVPAFATVLVVLPPALYVGLTHVLTAARLVFIGVVVARAIRRRYGLATRMESVPTVLVAAVLSLAVGWLVTALLAAAMGIPLAAGPEHLVALAQWLIYPLVGVLFVTPGEAELRTTRTALQSERGAISLATIPVAAGLVAVTLTAMHMLGSAATQHREAATAADAAALAAAGAWADGVEEAWNAARWSDQDDTFWAFAGTPLSDYTSATMQSRASDLAAANNAQLMGIWVDPSDGTVTVSVQDLSAVPHTSTRMEYSASASLRWDSGACRSGAVVGFLTTAGCQTRAPEPPPTPSPTPAPEPSEGESPEPSPSPTPVPPFEAPSGIGSFAVAAHLVPTR